MITRDRARRSSGGAQFSAALTGLRRAQKPGAGVPAYTRWVNRRLARFVAAAAFTLGLSPNAVTAISALLSLGGLVFVVALPATPATGFAAAGLLAAGYVLDSADGQVARLGRRGSPAGEWLDHVVDSIRTPAIHLAVFLGLVAVTAVAPWPRYIALAFCLMSAGQFMSQILAEQLSGAAVPKEVGSGIRQSWILLPTDMGVLCLAFAFWGFPTIFVIVYTALFALGVVHTLVSMRRKYVRLQRLGAAHGTHLIKGEV
ncbi:MAG: CDP-alcohol phosphatidyltransferase family protein [Microbacteriaceae bacterium]